MAKRCESDTAAEMAVVECSHSDDCVLHEFNYPVVIEPDSRKLRALGKRERLRLPPLISLVRETLKIFVSQPRLAFGPWL